MADPKDDALDPSFYEGKNFLGRDTSVSLLGQEPGQPATALAAGGAPVAAAGGPGGGTPGGGEVIAGSGAPSSILKQLIEGLDAGRKVSALFDTNPTRGDTQGQSLSDQIRSTSSPSEGAPLGSGLYGSGPGGAVAEVSPAVRGEAFADVGNLFGNTATDAATGAGGAALEGGSQAALQGLQTGLELTLPSLAESLTGLFTSGAIPIIESFFGVGPFGEGPGNPASKLRETKNIRKDFADAWGPYAGQADTLSQVAGVDASMPKAEQITSLQKLLDQASYQVNQSPAVSQFTSTEGGKQKGLVKPVDVSGYTDVTGQLSRSGVLAQLLAADRLASLGALNPEQDPGVNPNGYLGILFAQGGVDTSKIPEGGDYTSLLTSGERAALASPGSRLSTLQAVLTRLNPEFANTPFGQQFSSVSGGGTPPDATAGGGAGAGLFGAPPNIAGGTPTELERV